MDLLYLGEIVNTHGLKGEIRIISEFEYKDIVFKQNTKLYIGKDKEEVKIVTYRPHKNYDMITLEGKNNIDDVIIYKGEKVYINRHDFQFDGYVLEDLIGLTVYSPLERGKVTQIINSKAHSILVITSDDKKYMVPNIPEFIKKVDLENKKIEIQEIEGLFDEN